MEQAEELLKRDELPKSFPVDDLEKDYRGIGKLLIALGLNTKIGISKDAERNSIWFRKRK